MRLSHSREKLAHLNRNEMLRAIRERRTAIRYHRDQKMDDRCWVDDYAVWEMLEDTKGLEIPPPFEKAMNQCQSFFAHRKAETPDPILSNAVLDSTKWDEELPRHADGNLLNELVRIQKSIRAHRDVVGRPRTLNDDRALYAVLPEKIPADFRLPSEEDFLGEAQAPRAGCPSFWRSHQKCGGKTHDLHAWGPCTRETK